MDPSQDGVPWDADWSLSIQITTPAVEFLAVRVILRDGLGLGHRLDED